MHREILLSALIALLALSAFTVKADDKAEVDLTATVVAPAHAGALKEYAQAILEAARAEVEGKNLAHKLDKVINHIEKSLNPDLWIVDEHLDSKHGHKVFNEEKKAVKKLMKLMDREDTPQPVKDVYQSAIDNLIEADDILSHAVYDEAQVYADDPKVDKELKKCEKEFEKVDEELAKGHYDKAIAHYKKAWKHAHKSLRARARRASISY